MATDDYAIVVGVWLYPGLEDLHGPENDAQAFADWLTSPSGGAVPQAQVVRILSSDFHPPFASADTAAPTRDAVEKAFDELQKKAVDNQHNRRGLRVGRRLYLYFGGHGFSPAKDESALLTANSTESNLRYHIPGRAWADWFHTANYFDEVVLFMDCCRNNPFDWPVNAAGYGKVIGARQGCRFFAFGTKWRKLSWERLMATDGKVHGVFTTALLAGLKGAAADPDTGIVTAKTLREYLLNYMKDFLQLAPEEVGTVDPEPDVLDLDNAGDKLVFVTMPPPRFPVTIHPDPTAAGKRIALLDHSFAEVESVTMPAGGVVDWSLQLKKGRYLPSIDGNLLKEEVFDVSGTDPNPSGKQVNLST